MNLSQCGSHRKLFGKCHESAPVLIPERSPGSAHTRSLMARASPLLPRGPAAMSPDGLLSVLFLLSCFHFVVGTDAVAKSMLGKRSTTELPAKPG